jgi:hypoxanthine phosphoribosyltransferase
VITEVLFSREAVESRVRELGRTITEDYSQRRPLVVALLKGSIVFMADLIRAIDLDVEVDFISISSYQNRSTSSGSVRLIRDLDRDIFDRDVLIVEDIIDSGLSLSYIRKMLLARNPKSLSIVAFLDKRERRTTEVYVDYVGLRIPDRFVVGYGLDYRERYRGLPFIAALEPEEIADGEGA